MCVLLIPANFLSGTAEFLLFREWSRSKGSMLAGAEDDRRGFLRHLHQAPAEDSGIDSDEDVQRRRAPLNLEMLQLNEFGSSDEELVLESPKPKWAKRPFLDPMLFDSSSSDGELILSSPRPKWSKRNRMENMEEGIPMLVFERPELGDSDTVIPESPDPSSPPLYEVELTASDEDDDSSLMELVIPLQPSAYNRLNRSKTSKACVAGCLNCGIFCCFPFRD